MSEHIEVAATAPAFPLILADNAFLATLAKVEEQVSALKITDAQSAQQAADLQQRLTGAGKKLDATRLALKRPFIDINAKIDETAREPMARIEKAKTVLKFALTAYDDDQQRKAQAAEDARRKELERLEKIRQAEIQAEQRRQAEVQRIAEEAAKAAAEAAAKNKTPVMELDLDDLPPTPPPPKTETEKAIEAVKFAPAPVMAKPTGVAFKVRLIHRVENVALLPESFVVRTPNDKAIRAVFCDGYKEGEPLPVCAGVRFEIDKQSVSTGRSVF